MTDIKELRSRLANTDVDGEPHIKASVILSLLDKIDELTNELAYKEREIMSMHELQAGEDL